MILLIMSDRIDALDALGEQIGALAAQQSVTTHRLLTLLREFDANGGAGHWDSTADWLGWRIGMSPNTAREHLRVAKALGELPEIDQAMGEARISYSQARAMTRIATPDNEGALLQMAKNCSAGQLETICRRYRQARNLAAMSPEERRAQSYVRARTLDNGLVKIDAVMEPDAAAKLLLAIEQARKEDVSAETSEERSYPTKVEGLMRVVESFHAHGAAARPHGEQAMAFVHVEPNQDVSAETSPSAWTATLQDGSAVSPEAFSRMACGMRFVVVKKDENGRVMGLSSKGRSASTQLTRAIELRDHGTCRFPGCNHSIHTEIHHVKHRAHGGETTEENLITLCDHHHSRLHDGAFSIEVVDGDFAFRAKHGQVIERVPPRVAPAGVEPIDGGRLQPDWYTPKPNYDAAVGALA